MRCLFEGFGQRHKVPYEGGSIKSAFGRTNLCKVVYLSLIQK